MDLANIMSVGKRKKKVRVGRGSGSGLGKTSGRGMNGAASKRGFGSRPVAQMYGVTDSYVRAVLREAGVARKPGRPW